MPAELPAGRWQTVTSVAPTSLSSIPVLIPIPRANKPSAIGHELKYFYDLFKYLNIYDGKYEIGTTPAILRFPPPPLHILLSLAFCQLLDSRDVCAKISI